MNSGAGKKNRSIKRKEDPQKNRTDWCGGGSKAGPARESVAGKKGGSSRDLGGKNRGKGQK